jgi:hypothetical protein
MTETPSVPVSESTSAPVSAAVRDGSADFDPYHGRWRLLNRKLRDVLDPDCMEWVEFEATTEVQPIFGGLGNVEFSHNDYDPPFDGLTLRLYDPGAGLWRIWWASTRAPGQLGPPGEGRFVDGRAVFCSDELLAGRMTKVRIEWTGLAEGTPHWEQSFSYDGGQTWKTNWIIISTREQ